MGFEKVVKNSFFYTLANILQGLVSFFLLPVYTRFLTPLDYAILALVTSFIAIISSFITLQIHTGVSRFVIKFMKDQKRARTYFSSIFLMLLGILLFGSLLINLFGEQVVRIMFSKNNDITYTPFFQIATWTLLPNLLISGGLLLLQALEKGIDFLLVVLMRVVVNVASGLFFVVYLKTGVIGVLWAQLISAVCALVFIIWLIRDWLVILPRFPLKDIKDSIKYSLPIIPHLLGMHIYMYSDRLILQRSVPLADIGIYSVAGTFAYLLLEIVNATTTAYSPRFLKLAEEDKLKTQRETRRFIEIWWGGIMFLFMGYLLFADTLVRLMTRPAFYSAISLIPIIASAYIFRGLYCFATNGIFFREKTKFIPVITVIAALINIALNLIFIPRYGIFAAAWNTVISYFATFAVAYYISSKYYPIIYPWKNMLKIILSLIAIYTAVKIFNSTLALNMAVKFSFNIIMFFLYGITIILISHGKYFFKPQDMEIRL